MNNFPDHNSKVGASGSKNITPLYNPNNPTTNPSTAQQPPIHYTTASYSDQGAASRPPTTSPLTEKQRYQLESLNKHNASGVTSKTSTDIEWEKVQAFLLNFPKDDEMLSRAYECQLIHFTRTGNQDIHLNVYKKVHEEGLTLEKIFSMLGLAEKNDKSTSHVTLVAPFHGQKNLPFVDNDSYPVDRINKAITEGFFRKKEEHVELASWVLETLKKNDRRPLIELYAILLELPPNGPAVEQARRADRWERSTSGIVEDLKKEATIAFQKTSS